MSTLFIRYPRFLLLLIVLTTVAGTLAFIELPRMEDPPLTPRAATITTLFPGADAGRIESLVTEKLEEELKEIEEIKEFISDSRPGVSSIVVKLLDTITPAEAPLIWSRIRDKVDEAKASLPVDALEPEIEELDIKAYALIVGLRWDLETPTRWGVLRRLTKQLKERIDAIPGTESSEIFGDPQEEIVVSVLPEVATSLRLDAQAISQQIRLSDAKVAAGQLYGETSDVLFEVSGELDSITELSHVPIQLNQSSVVELGDIATIERTIQTPLESKVLLHDRDSVALSVFVQPAYRLDRWMQRVRPTLEEFQATLPTGVVLESVFEQEQYVSDRMDSLLLNLLYGMGAVFLVILMLMGIRSASIISLALPLGCLTVLFVMYAVGIPIHQMSITGLIIALGLMIDNAIVAVDEVDKNLREGRSPIESVGAAVSFLKIPLAASTLTTIFSFAPIALMAGPSGEFVGSIATVTIVAVGSSLLLALTVIASVAALGLSRGRRESNDRHGEASRGPFYSMVGEVIGRAYRFPRFALLVTSVIPLLGWSTGLLLEEQFFPPADRAQFQIELELPGIGSLQETEELARQLRRTLLEFPEIQRVSWFLGESAPPFYYNLIPSRKRTARYGQAIVDCQPGTKMRELIRSVQGKLDSEFPEVTGLARQLEQGPPFAAPVEARVFGPDPAKLRELGDQIRLAMTQTPDIVSTRSNFTESIPKVTFTVDERQARLAGLDHLQIAAGLASLLEGVTGGSILEETEELPIRVRISRDLRGDLARINSIDLLAASSNAGEQQSGEGYQGVPISSLASLELGIQESAITRRNGLRMNEVQAYITAGVLPAKVQRDLEARLVAADFQLPEGYWLEYAGAAAERNDAVGYLVVNAALLFTLMVVTLVAALNSFRLAGLLFAVAFLAVGFSFGSLWLMGFPWGFMAIVGMMGMIGIAVNDSIVVLAALNGLPQQKRTDAVAVRQCVLGNSRHVIATTLTTVAGFTPLFLGGGEFWPPVAIAIAGGVVGATSLAFLFVPSAFMLLQPSRAKGKGPNSMPHAAGNHGCHGTRS